MVRRKGDSLKPSIMDKELEEILELLHKMETILIELKESNKAQGILIDSIKNRLDKRTDNQLVKNKK